MSIISIQKLVKKYPNGREFLTVLNEIDFQVSAGEFVCLRGRSGCGKTTLLQIIGCLDRSESGDYFFNKQSVKDMNENELTNLRRQKIGFIFQTFNLVSTLKVGENVEYPLILMGIDELNRKKMVAEILTEVGLEKFSQSFPAKLSGGQRQRVAIARALVKKPDVIIADEPTANLDEENSIQIAELLIKLQKQRGVSIVCSSHDSTFANFSDKRYHIVNGKAVAE